ncbi:LytTR family DNA-binding domain-containing protein [Acidobacteriota bacterium]
MIEIHDRVVIHTGTGEREVIDPSDVYFLEAAEGRTLIRFRSSRPVYDIRLLGELEPLFEPSGFFRIHRNYMVNLRRIRKIRRRKKGEEWELKLEPPVNRVLPISRKELKKVWAVLGEQ